MDDYALVMSILSRNLGEGVREFPPREPAFIEKPSMASMYSESRPTQSARPSPILPEKIFETLKFNFQFDGVVINLMEGKLAKANRFVKSIKFLANSESYLDQSSGLACFGIYFLSVKGTQLNNGTLSLSIVLCNIQLDDTRSSNRSKIRQYLSCKDWDEVKSRKAIIVETCQNEPNYMVDVTAIIKENDIFGNLHRSSIYQILC